MERLGMGVIMKFLLSLFLLISLSAFGAVPLNTGPRFAAPNVNNGLRGHREQGSDNGSWMTEGNQTSNRSDLFCGELRGAIALAFFPVFQAVHISVSHVLAAIRPFKVFNAIVGLYAVFMIHLFSLWVRFKKCRRHESGNIAVNPFSVLSKVNMVITVPVKAWFQHVRWTRAPSISSNSSQIAYGIIRRNRYCFPLLLIVINLARHFKPSSSRFMFRCGMRRQPHLVPLLWICIALATSFFGPSTNAAVPSYISFIGTNGITVSSNPPQGKILISGSGIAGTAAGDTYNVQFNTNDAFAVNAGVNIYPFAFFSEFGGPYIAVNNPIIGTNFMDPSGFGTLGTNAMLLYAAQNAKWRIDPNGALTPYSFLSNANDVGSFLLPVRTNWVNDLDIKEIVSVQGTPAIWAYPAIRSWYFGGSGSVTNLTNGAASDVVAIGPNALTNGPGGAYNIAVGSLALAQNETGSENTAVGAVALRRNTTGAINVAIGSDVLTSNTIGWGNLGVGWAAGMYNTIGSYNTFVGYLADGSRTNLTNSSAIGTAATVDTKNTMVFGGTGANAVDYSFGVNSNDLYGGHVTMKSLYQARAANTAAQLFVANNEYTQSTNTGGAIDLGGYNDQFNRAYSYGRIQALPTANTGHGGKLSLMYLSLGGVMTVGVSLYNNGNVGFGTTLPSEKLDVVGQVRMVSAQVTNFVTFYPSTGAAARMGVGFLSGADATTSGTNFGFYNKLTDSLSLYSPDPSSNNWIMAGTLTAKGLKVGPGSGHLTNMLYASATLDFPSTVAGTVSDLPITVAGAADGDIIALGEPSGSIGPLTGVYNAWASNGVVYVRFANNNLATAQDPASGVFKVRVDKFQ